MQLYPSYLSHYFTNIGVYIIQHGEIVGLTLFLHIKPRKANGNQLDTISYSLILLINFFFVFKNKSGRSLLMNSNIVTINSISNICTFIRQKNQFSNHTIWFKLMINFPLFDY